jgi:hypothetical protein
MKISTASRYKFLKDYRLGIPELLYDVKYQGTILYNQNENRINAGWVPDQIYKQLGSTFITDNFSFTRAFSVSLNGDGYRMAISNPSGVEIYQFNENVWNKMGSIIPMENIGNSGTTDLNVSLNYNGDRIVIGTTDTDINGRDSGKVCVYQWNGGSTNIGNWTKLGQDINGEAADYRIGYSVSINDVGNKIIIGSPNHGDTIEYEGNGVVKVYELSSYNNNNAWIQIGQTLSGTLGGEKYGYNVSINSNGDKIIIGSTFSESGTEVYNGAAEIYQLSSYNNNNSWVKLGQTILGDSTEGVGLSSDGYGLYDNLGYNVGINSTGDIVIVGIPYDESINGMNSGRVRVYKLINNNWTQLGQDIIGKFENSTAGYTLSINSEGNRIVISDSASSRPRPGCYGEIYIYDWNESTQQWIKLDTDVVNDDRLAPGLGFKLSLNKNGNILLCSRQRGFPNVFETFIYDINSIKTLDKPFTSFNDENISVVRPIWKYQKNLNIIGGWYDVYNNQFITNTNNLSLSSSSNLNIFSDRLAYKGYKWIEIATKKNTNFSLSAVQLSAIYFKKYGWNPLGKPGPYKWNFPINYQYNNNNKIYSTGTGYRRYTPPQKSIIDNLFLNVVLYNTVLTASPLSEHSSNYINYVPEIPLDHRGMWYFKYENSNNIQSISSSELISLSSNGSIWYSVSTTSYKNTDIQIDDVTSFVETTDIDSIKFARPLIFELAYNARYSLQNRIVNVPLLTSTKNLFTIKNPTTNTFIRNPNVWCNDLINQLTSQVVYKDFSLYSYGGILITPRHVLYVAHAHPQAKGTWPPNLNQSCDLRFVKTDNTSISCVQLHQARGNGVDLVVAVIDRDLSLSGIHVMPIASLSPYDAKICNYIYMPKLIITQGLGRYVDRSNPNLVHNSNNVLTGSDIQAAIGHTGVHHHINNYAWDENAVGYQATSANPFRFFDVICGVPEAYSLWDGDSGTNACICVNNNLYLWNIIGHPGGWGPVVAPLSATINSMIEQADNNAISMGRLQSPTGLKPTYYTIEQMLNR